MSIREPELAFWPVDRFKIHPLQTTYFRWDDGLALKELADDIRRHGLREPIDVADDVILAGHRRWKAILKYLPEMHAAVPVMIRHDLVAQGPAATERYFLESNLNRRQLTSLEAARAYKRLKELEQEDRKSHRRSADDSPEEDYRDLLAKRFGFTGHRQLDRLCLLLELPIELQRACESNAINQTQAKRLLDATAEVRETAVSLAREGKLDGKTIKKLLGRPVKPPLTEHDFHKLWEQMLQIASRLRYAFPRSFEAALPRHDREIPTFLKRQRVLLALTDEMRRQFLPDVPYSEKPMKPVLKVPLSLRIEWLREKHAAEDSEEDSEHAEATP